MTAPVLLGMHSRRAAILGGALVAALLMSATATMGGVARPILFAVGLAVAVGGAVGMLMVARDPMPWTSTLITASTGPIACILTCASLPGPPADPNQLNVFGTGVAICAFMCVRGRTATAWSAFAVMSVVLCAWSVLTGQGSYGLQLSLPNVALVGMSTLFAVVVRPTAERIRHLTDESLREARALAATDAREAEAAERHRDLRRTAWPVLQKIADRELTATEVHEIGLTEKYLRDRIRARRLDTTPVVDAARRARSRGVTVIMLDDGDSDSASPLPPGFIDLAAQRLDAATSGVLTLRLHPAGRDVAASIVASDPAGTGRRIDIDATGARIAGQA